MITIDGLLELEADRRLIGFVRPSGIKKSCVLDRDHDGIGCE
jgi:hypothetical protein